MPFQLNTAGHRVGLALYFIGLVIYSASQIVLVVAPQSAWSMSIFGFTAGAYTTLIWILGIGMMGDRLFYPRIPWCPWIYFALALGFVGAHTAHAALVYMRDFLSAMRVVEGLLVPLLQIDVTQIPAPTT